MIRPDGSISSNFSGAGGGGTKDGGDANSSGVCYDTMSSFNVTVSLQPKSPSSPVASAKNSIGTTQSLGNGSLARRPSLESASSTSVVSQTPSLAESIGNFDPDKADKMAKQALVSVDKKQNTMQQQARNGWD